VYAERRVYVSAYTCGPGAAADLAHKPG
jgi:hypothetical protein